MKMIKKCWKEWEDEYPDVDNFDLFETYLNLWPIKKSIFSFSSAFGYGVGIG